MSDSSIINHNVEEADYNNYRRSIQLLKKGCVATKFNYTNNGIKKIVLKMSEGGAFLEYEPVNKTWVNYF